MVNHLITEPVKLTGCPRCGEYVIAGLSGGMLVKASPGQLSANEEIAALLTGKSTYDLIPFGVHFYLEKRDLDRIKAGRPYAVVATHACQPASAPLDPLPDVRLTTVPAVPLPGDPPF